MSDSEDSDDVFAVAQVKHAFSDDSDEDGAEAKFLGVSKPQPCQSTGGVPVAAAASSVQTAPARNAVLDEWGDDVIAEPPAAKKPRVAAQVDPTTAEAYWRNQQILKKLQTADAEEISDDDVVCAADGDGDVQIVEPPESAKKGAPLTLVLRTKRNKSFEVETTTTTPLSEVFDQFHASELGQALAQEMGRQATFSFDGEALQRAQTPAELQLEHRDIVDAR